ncbi:MAG TPA: ChaN family lipoprotein [Nitrospiraceae bacterium]|nr:ChaN family lipoprotein [Nitrospiraceae bacterium]
MRARFLSVYSLGRRSAVILGLLAGMLAFPIGCGAERDAGLRSDADGKWQSWQALDTQTGRIVPFSEFMTKLEQQDIVYLGEEHHNPYHIQAALKVLDQLVADGIEPTIGMEMFGWDGQSALDGYVATPQSVTNEFLEQVRWKQNWGGAFEDYAPLVTFARDRHLTVLAMNPPKPLVRRVVKLGLDQARQEREWEPWGILQEDIVDDPAYRERIVDQLRRCHGGTEEHFRTMYEASMVRDEGMARTLVHRQEEFRRESDGLRRMIVSYTGGGHVQYGLPVPKRVARRLGDDIKQITIYMMSFEPGKTTDVQALIQDPIADYIWLTPMGKSSSTKPCR